MICLNNAILSVRAGLNRFVLLLFLLHFSILGIAQNKESADSLVRLVEAKSAHLIEIDNVSYRKIVGPATFLHNNTYLKCDTALWNVNTNIINAVGNVQIIQENTFLTSDEIEYIIPQDLAKFRGHLVQLFDKEGNILNTNHLDYNTKDSIAIFSNGAALKNDDGNIIESINGIYQSKEKLLTFRDSVQMFTDSVFIITNKLDYKTDTDVAYFGEETTAWREGGNMLYANSGRFNRRSNLFIFDKDGYILTKEQELWADLLHYYRNTGNADLFNNIQVLDTVQSSIGLADKAIYRPNPRMVQLTENPAVGMYSLEEGVADTLFLRADTIKYYTKRMYEVDSSAIKLAQERLQLSAIDPIAIHDKERREARTKKTAVPGIGAAAKNLNQLAEGKLSDADASGNLLAVVDTLSVKDKLSEADSLIVAEPAVQLDTTEVIFLDAFRNVKFHRSDVQGVCDSLVYTGLDSMARFYINPAMWQDGKNQFTADSIQAHIKNEQLNKINLISNAFIATQEDSIHYNQIKSTEMAAYFSNNELYRFDALGGVSAIFYLEENGELTLMDSEECKMLTARIKDNQIQRTRSIQDLKQNVYPLYNLPLDQQRLRGFLWRGDERPKTRFEVTDRVIKESRREEMESIPLPTYKYTQKYFPQQADLILKYKENIQ